MLLAVEATWRKGSWTTDVAGSPAPEMVSETVVEIPGVQAVVSTSLPVIRPSSATTRGTTY